MNGMLPAMPKKKPPGPPLKLPPEARQFFIEAGRRGGQAKAKKLTAKERKAIGRALAAARKAADEKRKKG